MSARHGVIAKLAPPSVPGHLPHATCPLDLAPSILAFGPPWRPEEIPSRVNVGHAYAHRVSRMAPVPT